MAGRVVEIERPERGIDEVRAHVADGAHAPVGPATPVERMVDRVVVDVARRARGTGPRRACRAAGTSRRNRRRASSRRSCSRAGPWHSPAAEQGAECPAASRRAADWSTRALRSRCRWRRTGCIRSPAARRRRNGPDCPSASAAWWRCAFAAAGGIPPPTRPAASARRRVCRDPWPQARCARACDPAWQ